MTQSLPNVAIIGRPNVGKSTIFNRLVGRRAAVVNDQAGVTRDRNYSELQLPQGKRVQLIDTAGYEEGTADSLAKRMNDVSKAAVDEAVAVVFVLDGTAGVTPMDAGLARMLQKSGKPIILVANKADTKKSQEMVHDIYSLGMGDPMLVSAEHGIGFADLLEAIGTYAVITEDTASTDDDPFEEIDQEEPDEETLLAERRNRPLKLTIVGRPNAGKSTLVNKLLKEDRMLTGPEAGLTRESVTTAWEWNGQRFELIDTAGLRKKARITDKLEKISASVAIRAIEHSDVVLLIIDATQPLEHQDRTIASRVIESGRPLLIVLNKWDLIPKEDQAELLDETRWQLDTGLSQVKNIPMLTISALTGYKVDKLLKPVMDLYDLWHKRVSTGQLNKFLEGMLEAHHPPLAGNGKRVKIKYMAQTGIRPPTFTLMCNLPKAVPDSYLRYLSNGVRETFGFDGIPMRMKTRAGDNPYKSKQKKR